MSETSTFSYRVNRLGLACAMVAIATGVITAFLPLDIPSGETAAHAERLAWLSDNRGLFILGWINQILAMLSLSGVLLAIAWQVQPTNALCALLAAVTVLISVVAFLIPKFIAVWTIPLLADAVAINSAGSSMADTLLLLLNVSLPYSLFTSFDYLGFWLYAVFALLVAPALYLFNQGRTLSWKVTAASLGVFGVVYHVLMGALLWGAIPAAEINSWFLGVSSLLLVVVVAAAFGVRRELAR